MTHIRNTTKVIVILAAKAKFSTTPNSKKVSTNKHDIDGQSEIAIGLWPPKPVSAKVSEV